MIKVIFFDLDGVLTTDAKGSLTMSKNLCAAKAGLSVDDVLKSFRKDIEPLNAGECTLQSVLQRVCKEFSIPFSEDFVVKIARTTPWNIRVIELGRSLMPTYACGIITDNSKERMDILRREPELAGFDPIIVSSIEKASKSDGSTSIYDRALERAGCTATEAMFIDNQQRNLITPATMGMATYFHDDALNDIEALRSALHDLGVTIETSE